MKHTIKKIKKLLIANRGEIACRIIKTAKALNIKTVVVYSDADKNSLAVEQADAAVYIGASDAKESYLNIKTIIDVAKKNHVDAIHPGYGFLSENAAFADAVTRANILWIGPSSKAISAMGCKDQSRKIMRSAGIPILAGLEGNGLNTNELIREAEKLPFPLIIKASAGGGGKGMRIVQTKKALPDNIDSVQREALAAFGKDDIIVEQYLEQARHIEIQVLFDHHGHGIYLFERDCSVQRRYQKIIEEAPASNIDSHLRQQLGRVALKVAKAIDYANAGTVEFLLDKNQQFYFMEMNTRLQVEHPVTEMICGEDLVAWQLAIAEGQKLTLQQKDLAINGHAVEARLYAENPKKNFIPDSGKITHIDFPKPNQHLRIETGVKSEDSVTSWYDPMLAKIVAWGKTREAAIDRLSVALTQTHVVGITTNRDFLLYVLNQPKFEKAAIDNGFVDQLNGFNTNISNYDYAHSMTALCLWQLAQTTDNLWQQDEHRQQVWQIEAHYFRLKLHRKHNQKITAGLFAGKKATTNELLCVQYDGFTINENQITLKPTAEKNAISIYIYPSSKGFCLISEKHTVCVSHATYHTEETRSPHLRAPMNGRVTLLMVNSGDCISENEPLMAMEAMKMEYMVKAPFNGKVKTIYFQSGDLVEEGATLIELLETP